jgi:hypothetical protein
MTELVGLGLDRVRRGQISQPPDVDPELSIVLVPI